MPSINPEFPNLLDEVIRFMLKDAAQYFVQGVAYSIPTWTGQARASLTRAAIIVGVTIQYPDIQEPNRKGKTRQTGIGQGSARFFKDSKEYGFSLRSWVEDLNKHNGINYLLENEEEATEIKNTPWQTLDEAGEETEKYIVSTLFPVLRDLLNQKPLLKTVISVG